MISAPLGMGFPLSAHVPGKRLVICLGSFFIFSVCVCVFISVQPKGPPPLKGKRAVLDFVVFS